MEHIKVTPQMQARVLHNLSRMDLAAAATPAQKRKKALSFPQILSLAACVVLLVAGALTLQGRLARQPAEPPPLQTGAPTQYDSLKALCDAASFGLLAPADLPAGMQAQAYTLLGNGTAEIVYSDGSDTLIYRMAAGTEDISGDYTDYPVVEVAPLAGREVTLKGDAEGYCVATWTQEGYTFAVACTRGLTQGEIEGMIASLGPCA